MPTPHLPAENTPVIVAAKRTPIGKFFGGFSKVPSPVLGSYAIKSLLDEVPALKDKVDEVIMGCVLQAGLGQNPARQAGLKAGLPNTLSAKTINKVCGSGLESVMLAAQSIKAGDNQVVIAGGFENMTLAPHMTYARTGFKFGEAKLDDHMQYDGLRCPFENWGMVNAADHTAKKHNVSRADQDAFAAQSHQRAAEATKNGWFKSEIVAISGEQCLDKKSPGVSADEGIRAESTAQTMAALRPVNGDGTVTAANASQISDGAAAVAVMSAAMAEKLGIKPLARIVAYHTSGVAPKELFDAPIDGISAVLKKAGLGVGDIDLFELNEAFAAQVLADIRALGIPQDKLNICGGGIALGHPIGASGARVLTTLLHQLIRTNKNRGVASLCLGGGNAVSMVVER